MDDKTKKNLINGKKVSIITLGCKVNAYESQAIRDMFEQFGAVFVEDDEPADVCIVNTCSVTGIADKKSRQMLHRMGRTSSNGLIVATGCYAQAVGDKITKEGMADIVVGANRKDELLEKVAERLLEKNSDKVFLSDTKVDRKYMNLGITDFSEKTRAVVKVQDGCNQFCTYCIIPHVRGRVRSRSIEDTVEEVKRLAGAGYREVVLTGIHLSSYGRPDYEKGQTFDYEPLFNLIEATAQVDGISRIRLGSLEPRIISEESAKCFSGISKLCPQFHLSFQSGCDSVLKRMNRHYDVAEYEEKCAILRNAFDRPAITTDIIVGFPGETREDFLVTVDTLKRIGFAQMHIFKYSKRNGTPAAVMKDQVTDEEASRRSDILIDLGHEMRNAYLSSFVGQEEEIIIEKVYERDSVKYYSGLTSRYAETKAVAGNICARKNDVIKVLCNGVDPCGLLTANTVGRV